MSDVHDAPQTGKLASESVLGGRYIVKKRLGQGGMGSVYLAHDERLEIDCAIKEMSSSMLKTDEDRERARKAFHEEAKLLARLNHPNLPRVTDHFTDHGKEYLVMEFVPGETLAQIMRRKPPAWPVRDVVELAEPLTEVLQYLHSQPTPIIFRDLKPANIMQTPEGKIKLIDFGIARLFKPGQSHDTQAFGTMGYSAPEQYGQGQTDARSDVYALGVLLHQLCTSHDPISQPFNVPRAHVLNPDIPEQLSAVLQTAMNTDPNQRFSSMLAFRRALVNATNTIPSQPLLVAQRPATPMAQPQQGINQPVSQAFQQPTPQQSFTMSPPYQSPTPPQPFAQPYNVNQPPQVYAQPYNVNQPPQVLPVVGGLNPAYPTQKSTGLALTGLWMAVASLILLITSIATYRWSDGLAAVCLLIGGLIVIPSFIICLIAISKDATKRTLKGRSHAGIGLALTIISFVLSCISLANFAN